MHSAQIVSAMHSDENSGDAQRCQNSAVKCRCGVPLCNCHSSVNLITMTADSIYDVNLDFRPLTYNANQSVEVRA